MRTNSSSCSPPPSSHPPRPPTPALRALSAVFLFPPEPPSIPLRRAPAAHPPSLGWRHTSSTPLSTQICAPSLLSRFSPAAAPGADARPTTARRPPSLPERLLLRAARLQASPHPCEHPARLGGSEVSASRPPPRLSLPVFPPGGCLLASVLLLHRPGGGQKGRRFRLRRALPCGCSLSPFPASHHSAREVFQFGEY